MMSFSNELIGCPLKLLEIGKILGLWVSRVDIGLNIPGGIKYF